MMPGELEQWLMLRMMDHGIAVKQKPSHTRMTQDNRKRFEHLLREYLIENIEQQFALTNLMIEFDRATAYTQQMIHTQLDEQVKRHLQQQMDTASYTTALHDTVDAFFERFISLHSADLRRVQ